MASDILNETRYFSRLFFKIALTTVILVFVANLALKGPGNFLQFLLFFAALFASILPKALPVAVKFILSRQICKFEKNNIVIKKASSIENLANIEILCAGKTGILTQNKPSLEKIVTSDKAKCLLYGLLSSGENKKGSTVLNPFDEAIFKRSSEEIFNGAKKFNIISAFPFDLLKMKSGAVAQSQKERILIIKGSPEMILKSCSKFGGNFQKAEIREDIEREGVAGKKVLAIGYKKLDFLKNEIKNLDEAGLVFLGYFVFEDPLKSTAEEAIRLSRKLDIGIKIITGDSKEAAGYAARKSGLIQHGQNIISGAQLEKLPADDFEDACRKELVFAGVSSDLERRIIKALEKNHKVGFIGKSAGDGISIDGGNIGLSKKDLKVVISGIKGARIIFSNIDKFIKCSLTGSFGNFYSMVAISLLVNFLPMLPLQILVGKFLSVFPLMPVTADSAGVEEFERPINRRLHIVLPLIIVLALVSVVFDFIFLSVFFRQPAGVVQTLWFIKTILAGISLIFIVRTQDKFWKAKKPGFLLSFSAIIVGIFAVVLPFLKIGQNWFHFVQPPILPLFSVFLLVGLYIVSSEFVKLIYFKHWKSKEIS